MCDTSCGPGTQTRVRYSLPPSLQTLSAACSTFDFIQQQACTGDTAVCPTMCVFAPWSTWGPCSRPCGGGTRYQTRLLLIGSATCGPLIVTQLCNAHACV
jgi:hypothetical protein